MEIAGSFLDEEWESLSQIFSSGENVDLFQHYPSPSFLPSDFSQESSNEALFFNIHHQPPPSDASNSFETMIMNIHNINAGFMLPDHDVIMEEFLRLEAADSCQIKRKSEEHQHDKSEDSPKKKPRFSRNQAHKNTSVHPKKGKKQVQDKNINEEEINGGGNNSYSSEDDDSNASQQLINEKINNTNSNSNSNSKARASRGSATDPQSLYARRRRERINERLKILQNLVPNGTKVDISTMLEEAVQYVKFLQLQIKLLSSDNMWMYAPLAYNGMDLGIYEKICPNLRQ